jgi:hypothetical protein
MGAVSSFALPITSKVSQKANQEGEVPGRYGSGGVLAALA